MATHGCTSVPCTICGSGLADRTLTKNVSVDTIQNTIWSPFRVVASPRRSPFEYELTAPASGVEVVITGAGWGDSVQHIVCPCNTISDFPEVCPYHSAPPGNVELTPGWVRVQPQVHRISDDDVDRIARRVADLLKEKTAKAKPTSTKKKARPKK